MSAGLTRSEQFVTAICERSFLKYWTHPNPLGKQDKELCDCLVVCGPHVIIFSVKEIEYRYTGDETGMERWMKKAITESVSQIAGAERWLRSVDQVKRNDGRVVMLPPDTERQYHRVAVALGGKGQVPLKWGELGKGFVHVCDEQSLEVLFSVLDTIGDFTTFLEASETYIRSNVSVLMTGGGIDDLLAIYLRNNHSFVFGAPDDDQPDMVVLMEGLWSGLAKSPEFQKWMTDRRESYFWDVLIDYFASLLVSGHLMDAYSDAATDDARALTAMALQPRGHRIVLAERFVDLRTNHTTNARVTQGFAGAAFVFTAGSSAEREARRQELALRCLVARARIPGTHTVVGIATDRAGPSPAGYSADLAYLRIDRWTDEFERKTQAIQDEIGYFKTLGATNTT